MLPTALKYHILSLQTRKMIAVPLEHEHQDQTILINQSRNVPYE